jgi:hypothetical protein
MLIGANAPLAGVEVVESERGFIDNQEVTEGREDGVASGQE